MLFNIRTIEFQGYIISLYQHGRTKFFVFSRSLFIAQYGALAKAKVLTLLKQEITLK